MSIPQLLKKSPEEFGFLKGRWVLRDISKALKKEGIKLHYSGVYRVLRELKIKRKSPILRAPGSLKKNYRKRHKLKKIILFIDHATYPKTEEVDKFLKNHPALKVKFLGKKDPNSNPTEGQVNRRLAAALVNKSYKKKNKKLSYQV